MCFKLNLVIEKIKDKNRTKHTRGVILAGWCGFLECLFYQKDKNNNIHNLGVKITTGVIINMSAEL